MTQLFFAAWKFSLEYRHVNHKFHWMGGHCNGSKHGAAITFIIFNAQWKGWINRPQVETLAELHVLPPLCLWHWQAAGLSSAAGPYAAQLFTCDYTCNIITWRECNHILFVLELANLVLGSAIYEPQRYISMAISRMRTQHISLVLVSPSTLACIAVLAVLCSVSLLITSFHAHISGLLCFLNC